MAALTAERKKTWEIEGRFRQPDVAADTKCFAGGLAVLNGSGDAAPGTAATGLTAIGRFEETVDNTGGAAGDKTAKVKAGVFLWDNDDTDTIDSSHIQSDAYIVDDQTVASNDGGGTRSKAGRIVDVTDDGVFVATGMP